MALVLCTGIDPVLITTRKLILEQAGHQVVAATHESAITAACQEHKFDVAVIGQAVSVIQKQRILALIRKHCLSAKVLELYRFNTGKIL
jgi:CheY-like chemotaxis protein